MKGHRLVSEEIAKKRQSKTSQLLDVPNVKHLEPLRQSDGLVETFWDLWRHSYSQYFFGKSTTKLMFTAQKAKFSIKDFFSKCDRIRRKLRIWSHLLKKSLMENFIFFVQWYM